MDLFPTNTASGRPLLIIKDNEPLHFQKLLSRNEYTSLRELLRDARSLANLKERIDLPVSLNQL